MTLAEYAAYDVLGLADLVATKQVSPKELARLAAAAIDAVNPAVNAVVETCLDQIDDLDEQTRGTGPFRGVPSLIKDFFGHEAGRHVEFGSRLCRGIIAQQDTHLYEMVKAAGLNILGRSAAPEYSMAGTTETLLYGYRRINPRPREFLRRRRAQTVARPRLAGAAAGRERLRPQPELRADEKRARCRGDARLRRSRASARPYCASAGPRTR